MRGADTAEEGVPRVSAVLIIVLPDINRSLRARIPVLSDLLLFQILIDPSPETYERTALKGLSGLTN